jgi:hypothetical protein
MKQRWDWQTIDELLAPCTQCAGQGLLTCTKCGGTAFDFHTGQPSMKIYIVVEQSGYEDERDIKTFTDLDRATKWVRKTYTQSEIEQLHIMIATQRNGERSYEF